MNLHQLAESLLAGRSRAEIARAANLTDQHVRSLLNPGRPWKNFLDPPTYGPLARGLGTSVMTVLQATAWSVAEYNDLPELKVAPAESRFRQLLPPGDQDLRQEHLDLLLPWVRHCVDDARATSQVEQLETRISELEAQLAEATAKRGRR